MVSSETLALSVFSDVYITISNACARGRKHFAIFIVFNEQTQARLRFVSFRFLLNSINHRFFLVQNYLFSSFFAFFTNALNNVLSVCIIGIKGKIIGCVLVFLLMLRFIFDLNGNYIDVRISITCVFLN